MVRSMKTRAVAVAPIAIDRRSCRRSGFLRVMIPASPGYAPPLPYSGLAAGDDLLAVPNGSSVTAFVLSSCP